ncbi:hypothetical protein AWB76_02360 [Caballeronia temeraria]|uniref:Uncharacterized protein n=1 Tax=Caballeronia temeraria TaxID=1777137 RepID=A0A158AG88_9BURK|nr:hypothetical protein [Caballeronia temeraria]SAK56823.1 hypothetical protein AWB76_02360 [Caballeronia temeraria]
MKHARAQEAVLARMAESRAELIAARIASEPVSVSRVPRTLPATTRAAPWFLRTPNAELVALALVGVAILGLRRTVQTAVGAGLSASTHRVVDGVLDALRN